MALPDGWFEYLDNASQKVIHICDSLRVIFHKWYQRNIARNIKHHLNVFFHFNMVKRQISMGYSIFFVTPLFALAWDSKYQTFYCAVMFDIRDRNNIDKSKVNFIGRIDHINR